MNLDFYTYRVNWSPEDGEYVGLCVEWPSLSWLAESQEMALAGIGQVVASAVADMQVNGEEIPTPVLVEQLSKSTARANTAIDEALTFVETSNNRIAEIERKTNCEPNWPIGTYRVQDACANCRHVFARREYDEDNELYCTLRVPERPPWSVVMGESKDVPTQPWGQDAEGYQKWDAWKAMRRVVAQGICGEWTPMSEETKP